jgi:hypothetical protein
MIMQYLSQIPDSDRDVLSEEESEESHEAVMVSDYDSESPEPDEEGY